MALMSTELKRAYISSYYRKQTKNQWARDDPAFLGYSSGAGHLGELILHHDFRKSGVFGDTFGLRFMDYLLIINCLD